MQHFLVNSILLLVALLPVAILGYGSTVESIIDSILKDAPEYLSTNGAKFHVESVGSLVRSCSFIFYDILLNGEVTYTLSTCINATQLILISTMPLVDKVMIGLTKLDISVQISSFMPDKTSPQSFHFIYLVITPFSLVNTEGRTYSLSFAHAMLELKLIRFLLSIHNRVQQQPLLQNLLVFSVATIRLTSLLNSTFQDMNWYTLPPIPSFMPDKTSPQSFHFAHLAITPSTLVNTEGRTYSLSFAHAMLALKLIRFLLSIHNRVQQQPLLEVNWPTFRSSCIHFQWC
ncbi:hypothetical protein ECG_09679 [Echinococcus granulosus]|nr:hypothetical protein ECG_09679 [Echinococcus granulosus]